jgi:glycosyltransferase involved in cell wall biosynthesis
MIINQWVPAAHHGDAVGDDARAVRDVLRSWGHESEIYALTIDEGLADEIRPWRDAAARDGDVTLLHFALPSPMTHALRTLPGARVLYYHNVTPAHFFAPFAPALVRLSVIARRELADLAGHVDLAVGVSEFNRQELDALGFRETAVLPIAVNVERLTGAGPVPSLERLLGDGLANILFVGRIAPNKKIEDHIRLAEAYKRYVDAHYRFIFVGRTDGVPHYYEAIQALIAEYQMLPERFWFTGPVPDRELAAYYRHAHAYVSLSEHEGFCVPLVEAMAMDVPVLAYASSAVPETLGGAGVSFSPKDLEQAAELLGALVYDEALRQQVLAGQRRRLTEFSPARFEARLRHVLAPFAA